ncbi:hypothetical protein [Geotalea toluenoxydans]
MFTLKESVDCIEAAESDITDIHKSRSAVAITPNGLPKQLYDAFICSIKEGESLQVYVALATRNSKKALVYTAAGEAAILAGTELLLEEALEFLKDMGFEMEHVDLNYSVALREVVLRGIRVIRPVSAARLAARKQAATEKTAAMEDEETRRVEEDSARKKAEEAAKAAADKERKAAEEAARIKAEEERKAAEEAARIKAEEERKAAEEAARVKAEEERKTAEEAARVKAEEERKAAEEAARIKAEKERKAAEEAARIKAEEERKAAEKAARVKAEEERKAAEEAARINVEEERKAAEEAARIKTEENRRLAELATEERQEAEKMVAEKAEIALQIKEKLEAEKLAAEERISALSEAEKNAADTILEEKEAAEKARAERLAAEERLVKLLEAEKLAGKKALAAQDNLAAATAARMEAEQLFLQKNEEEKIAEEQAEEERRTVRKTNEDRIAAEETVDIIGQFEERATGRCLSAKNEAKAAAAEKAAAEELLSAKTAELRSALEAAEAERIMIEKILEKKIFAEKAAYQAADIPLTASDARREETIEAVTEPPTPPAGKVGRSEDVQEDRKKEDHSSAVDISLHKAEIERLREEKTKAEAEWKAAAEEASRLKAETDRLMALRLKAEEERLSLQSENVGSASAPGVQEEKKRHQDKSSGRKMASEGELNVSVSSVGAWKRAAMTASDPIDYGGPPVEAGSDPFAFPDKDDGAFFSNNSSTGGSGSTFTCDPAHHSIEYASQEEIIELHESSNLARVALEGNPSQNCKSYICAMKRGEECYVYVAIVLTENDKVLVYNTDNQPTSAAQLPGAIADAVQFLELIGFMTGTIKLDTDKAGREAAIGKIPVLHRLSENR